MSLLLEKKNSFPKEKKQTKPKKEIQCLSHNKNPSAFLPFIVLFEFKNANSVHTRFHTLESRMPSWILYWSF